MSVDPTKTSVQYSGATTWTDRIYGSGLVFAPDQIRDVDPDLAKKLLRHADVFSEASESLPEGDVTQQVGLSADGEFVVEDFEPMTQIETAAVRTGLPALQSGIKFDGAHRQLTDPGTKVVTFSASTMSTRTGSPTIADVSGADMSEFPIDGSQRAVQLVCGSTFDELNIVDANLTDFAIDNMFGMLVYIKGCPGKGAGETAVGCYLKVTLGCDSGTAYTNYVAVTWNNNQLREGFNWLVWRPASDVHPTGIFVSTAGTGLTSILAGTTVKKMILSASVMNSTDTEIYLISAYTGFYSKGGVVFNIDAAGNDVLNIVIPYMDEYGWIGNIMAAKDGSGNYTLETLMPIDFKLSSSHNLFGIYEAGWQVSPHSMTHRNISSMTDQGEVYAELKMSQWWLLANGFQRGNNYYAAPQNQISSDSFDTMSALVDIQRGYYHANVNPCPWGGIDSAHFGSTGWENRTLTAAWSEIKALLDYGAMCVVAWHTVTKTDDPEDGSTYGTGSGATTQYWSNAKTILDNIRALELEGSVIVFQGFDDYVYGRKIK